MQGCAVGGAEKASQGSPRHWIIDVAWQERHNCNVSIVRKTFALEFVAIVSLQMCTLRSWALLAKPFKLNNSVADGR